ncbi:MAG: sulfatase [Promethearchaeota archaeon]
MVLFKILDEKFASPLTKENIFLFVIIVIFSILVAGLSYKFILVLLLKKLKKISFYNFRRIFLSFKKAFIFLIALNIFISIIGLFSESKEKNVRYIDINSKTKDNSNIILIVIDALRADHLSCYGYKRQTSPHIDAFSKNGVIFKNCRAQASWTKPSVTSILTSLFPSMHHVNLFISKVPDELNTLQEILQKSGYITYAYVANAHLKSEFNFNQGFDFYDDYLIRDKVYYIALRNLPILKKLTGRRFDCTDKDNIKLANKRILPWLEKYKDENFFIYIHYMDPHSPYSPISPYKHLFSYSKNDKISKDIALYDEEIRFTDDYLGKLFEKLKQLGIYDKTMIIITADHGEAFGEHNDYEHGHTIYEEQLKVPLIIRFPRLIPKNKLIENPVKSIDIMPSILDMLNISSDVEFEGSSFFPLICNNSREQNYDRYILVEENFNNDYILEGLIYQNRWKYIFTEKTKLRDLKTSGQEELFDLIDDPRELKNLIRNKSEIVKTMKSKLKFYRNHCKKRSISSTNTKLDFKTKQQLKSLGYIK